MQVKSGKSDRVSAKREDFVSLVSSSRSSTLHLDFTPRHSLGEINVAKLKENIINICHSSGNESDSDIEKTRAWLNLK
jgi:hypothetical protein